MSFGEYSFRTARKPHDCSQCDKTIIKGKEYKYFKSCFVEDGSFEYSEAKICSLCIESYDSENWQHSLIEWCKRNGAEVEYRDYSYYVDVRLIPETHIDIVTENDEITLSSSAGRDFWTVQGFVEWIYENDDLPRLPEIVIKEFELEG
jgi:hypothetical protein